MGGANTTSFLAAHFAKRNTKNRGGEKRNGESEGGQKFLPPNPLPFCPPERKSFYQISQSGFSSKKVRILTKRYRNFSKRVSEPKIWSARSAVCSAFPPQNPFWRCILELARTEFAPRRAQRGSDESGGQNEF